MDGSEAEGDLVFIQTFLLYYVNQVIVMLTNAQNKVTLSLASTITAKWPIIVLSEGK